MKVFGIKHAFVAAAKTDKASRKPNAPSPIPLNPPLHPESIVLAGTQNRERKEKEDTQNAAILVAVRVLLACMMSRGETE